jgi:pimeloyl-ACP methyl ester carboxylesterase
MLTYDDAGRGECVVLIHGHPFDRTLWEPQVAALRGSIRVLAPERYWALGLVATTAEPPSPQDLRTRDERAGATERNGMSVLVDYMHSGLYGASCPPAVG